MCHEPNDIKTSFNWSKHLKMHLNVATLSKWDWVEFRSKWDQFICSPIEMMQEMEKTPSPPHKCDMSGRTDNSFEIQGVESSRQVSDEHVFNYAKVFDEYARIFFLNDLYSSFCWKISFQISMDWVKILTFLMLLWLQQSYI